VLEHVSTDALTSFLLYTLDAEDDPDAVLHRTHQFHSNAMHTARMSAAQKLIEQGRSEGIREGIREGKREGLREGKHEGERGGITASLLQNLQIRFGPIPDSIRSQLSSITSLERLMDLLSASIQCRSLDAFRESLSLTDSN
jgi:flagellar biosynthesis/type III secretory pathway protein FliH